MEKINRLLELNNADSNGQGGITRVLPRPVGAFVDDVVKDTSIILGEIKDFMTDNGTISYTFDADIAEAADIDTVIQAAKNGYFAPAEDFIKNPNNFIASVEVRRDFTAYNETVLSVGLKAEFPISTLNSVQDLTDFNVRRASIVSGDIALPVRWDGATHGKITSQFKWGPQPVDQEIKLQFGIDY